MYGDGEPFRFGNLRRLRCSESGVTMRKWYVVQTRPRQERRAEVNLARQGYRAWLPVMERSRRRAKRIETGHALLLSVEN